MNRMPKSIWYYVTPTLLLLAFSIYIVAEIAFLRKVPVIFGRIAPFLVFWSNIILSITLRPNESFPIWIVPMLNLGVLLATIVIYEIAIPVLRGCVHKGERS